MLSLFPFLGLTLGGGFLIGFKNRPDDWYRGLKKAPFNPPPWVFPPAWASLYVLIGIAGWRTWSQEPQSWAFAAWALQLALNFSWSPTFFGKRKMVSGLGIILALLGSIAAYMGLVQDPVCVKLFVPYALWVSFATVLNTSLIILNPQAR